MNYDNRIVGHAMVPPDQLLANPLNFRIHSKVQKDHMRSMLRTVGWLDEIIVNKNTDVMVNGHMRVDIALTDGEDLVPVRYVDLTEEEENIALATFDNIAALAGTDKDQLDSLLEGTFTEDDNLADFLRSLQSTKLPEYDEPLPKSDEDYSDQGMGDQKWFVLVTCVDEMQQTELLDRFDQEGISCKPLSTG